MIASPIDHHHCWFNPPCTIPKIPLQMIHTVLNISFDGGNSPFSPWLATGPLAPWPSAPPLNPTRGEEPCPWEPGRWTSIWKTHESSISFLGKPGFPYHPLNWRRVATKKGRTWKPTNQKNSFRKIMFWGSRLNPGSSGLVVKPPFSMIPNVWEDIGFRSHLALCQRYLNPTIILVINPATTWNYFVCV